VINLYSLSMVRKRLAQATLTGLLMAAMLVLAALLSVAGATRPAQAQTQPVSPLPTTGHADRCFLPRLSWRQDRCVDAAIGRDTAPGRGSGCVGRFTPCRRSRRLPFVHELSRQRDAVSLSPSGEPGAERARIRGRCVPELRILPLSSPAFPRNGGSGYAHAAHLRRLSRQP
jgi:hypothetical protein